MGFSAVMNMSQLEMEEPNHWHDLRLDVSIHKQENRKHHWPLQTQQEEPCHRWSFLAFRIVHVSLNKKPTHQNELLDTKTHCINQTERLSLEKQTTFHIGACPETISSLSWFSFPLGGASSLPLACFPLPFPPAFASFPI